MKRALAFAAVVVVGTFFACNGQLDAFSTQDAGVSSGTSGTGGVNGGGTTTGGRGGSGGLPPAGGEGGEFSGDFLLIDDFEDGNRRALLNNGLWYLSNDGTGAQTLAVSAPSLEKSGSAYALHTSGVGFEVFGEIVCKISGDSASFDASAFAALTFMARAEPTSSPDVLFSFLVGGQNFAVPVRLGTSWQPHTILFTDVLPTTSGPLTSFDPRAISAIQFVVPSDVSFDFWLDDLAFVK